MRALLAAVFVTPVFALSTRSEPPPCSIPKPCAMEVGFNFRACAEKEAAWIVEGTYSVVGGVHTIDLAKRKKGLPPVAPYRDGEFYLWRSCWDVRVEPGSQVRAYGHSDGGVFLVLPSGNERHRPSVP